MKDAFLSSQVRGTDSTGLFVLEKDNTATIHKLAINASNFLAGRTTEDLLRKVPRARFSLGHVRAATMGYVSAANAHPFRATREDGTFIIGAHNGTLTTWRTKKNADKYSVDSEWLFNMLAEEGHDAFEYFKGAFALIWYDSRKPDSIFMARTPERPLHYLVMADNKTMIGCSELGMLGWLSDKHSMKMHKDHPTPYYLEPGKIYEFSMNKIDNPIVVDFPTYDPSTSIAQSFTNAGGAGSNSGGSSSSYNPVRGNGYYSGYGPAGAYAGYNEDFVDDHYPDAWDYPATSIRRRSGPTTSTNLVPTGQTSNYWDKRDAAETARTLDAVKAALRKARTELFAKDKPGATEINKDDLESAIVAAIGEHQERKALMVAGGEVGSVPWKEASTSPSLKDGSIMVKDTTGSTATRGEKENAKKLDVAGTVVRFVGLWYDKETATCFGDFKIIENGVEQQHQAELRGIPEKLADELYIKSKPEDYELVAVVGVHDDVEYIVVEPLTLAQRAEVAKQLMASNTPTMTERVH